MPTVTILLAEQDAVIARTLAAALTSKSRTVQSFASLRDLRNAIPFVRPDAVIADLETITLSEVAGLKREFGLPVICTHRLPDDDLWRSAIEAGAYDICEKSDIGSMVRAICSVEPIVRAHAA